MKKYFCFRCNRLIDEEEIVCVGRNTSCPDDAYPGHYVHYECGDDDISDDLAEVIERLIDNGMLPDSAWLKDTAEEEERQEVLREQQIDLEIDRRREEIKED